MTADDFLNEFGHFADAPNGIKKLRELILQLAVRGKLVDQDPNDEPASELIKKIEAEKAKLIAEGKIKKQKPLPPVEPDQVPHELPIEWEWVRLGSLTCIQTGKLDANAASQNGKYPFFTCAKDPLRIDRYKYDCDCVLLAGNGNFDVNCYKGKFEAYQRTYIIEPILTDTALVQYLYRFMVNYSSHLNVSGQANSLPDGQVNFPT